MKTETAEWKHFWVIPDSNGIYLCRTYEDDEDPITLAVCGDISLKDGEEWIMYNCQWSKVSELPPRL